jgi:quercetin dioxygenase-like cupin family protein
MKVSRVLTIASGLLVHISVQAQHSTESHPSKVTQEIILRQVLNEANLKGKEVQMLIVDFPPGIVSGAHRHPCQTFGYLLEGELESEFEGKHYSYKAGDAFYELPNGLHSLTKNPSPTQSAKLLVFFILDTGKATSVRDN